MAAWSPMYVTDAEVGAVLSAYRVMVAIARRSHPAGHVVDPVQFRILMIISAGGGLPLGKLAEAVGVNAATAGRAYDQLVRGWFYRCRWQRDSPAAATSVDADRPRPGQGRGGSS